MNRSVIQYLEENKSDSNIPGGSLTGGVKTTEDPIKGIVARTNKQPQIQQPVEQDIPKHSKKLIPKTTISK